MLSKKLRVDHMLIQHDDSLLRLSKKKNVTQLSRFVTVLFWSNSWRKLKVCEMFSCLYLPRSVVGNQTVMWHLAVQLNTQMYIQESLLTWVGTLVACSA